ncbi:hypothetical protein SDC9_132470 [bioreactor metagenome]|uniref:Uncharacterized protein n=1 Tax=bioreactor metagenome TaxID=1076179 RepID=A0A645D791_9ZZZZ
MGNGVGALGLGNFHDPFGNDGAGKGGAEQIFALVNRTGLQGGENEIVDKFFLQIFYVYLRRAGLDGLFVERGKLLPLTYVGRDGDHLASVVFHKPRNDHRCIQPA